MSVVAGVRGRVVALPAWAWLVVIVVVSSVVRIVLVRQVAAPWIMVDEIVYSELAKSFAAHGTFLVRDVANNGYGFVYPMLISPAFGLFDSVPRAYGVAKDINAVVMSLAACPTYFLARRLVAPRLALVAAALSLVIPSLLYTGMLMTENAFYPLFLLVSFLLVVTLERPTLLRQVLLVALCGVGFATRAQAIAFVPAVLVAPVLHGLIERDLKVSLRRFLPLYVLAAAAAVLALADAVARGRSPLAVLGAYRVAVHSGYTIDGVLHYLLWHVAELDLYLGILPFAALLALWLAPRSASPAARAYVAATLPIAVFFIVEVAAFASTESRRIEERNDFYVAPLMLIALVALAGDRVIGRARRPTIAAAVLAGTLPVVLPFATFVNRSAVADTFGLLPWWWLHDQGITFGHLRVVALGVGLVAGAAFVVLPRRFALGLSGLVAVYFVGSSLIVEQGQHGIREASAGSLRGGIRATHTDWIDRAVGRADGTVAFVWHPTAETRPLWNNEFFSRSVGTVYTIDGPDPADGGLPETPVSERAGGTLVGSSGEVPRVRYAVSYTDIAGRPIARDSQIGLVLYRVDGPLVVLTHVTGLYPDTWAGRRVVYRRTQCSGGQLSVRLGTDEQLFTSAQIVSATIAGRVVARTRVAPAAQPTMRVPLRPDRQGVCSVTFTMAQLRVPARVQPGNPDVRRLGAHFFAIDYAP